MKLHPLLKNFILIVLILVVIGGVFSLFYGSPEKPNQISVSQLASDINADKVKKIDVSGDSIKVTYNDNKTAESMKESNSVLSDVLVNLGADKTKLQKVQISASVEEQSVWSWLLPALLYGVLPLLLIGFFLWTITRQAKMGAGQVFDFTRSRAKLFGAGPASKERITFKDAAGLKEAKEELIEIVDFLKFPKKYLAMGAKIPRGVLLLGSAGVGKCIVGESLIVTNKGIMEIKDVPKYFSVDPKSNKVYGANLPTLDISETKNKMGNASHWYDLGENKTVKITLKQGTQLEGTPEHPIVIFNEQGQLVFKKLEELKENDLVAITFNSQAFGHLNEVDSEKAYIMGLLTGDGNLSHAGRIGLTSTDPQIVGNFHSYMKDTYGGDTHIAVASDKITQLVTSWKIKKDFYNAGMSYLLSYDKTIPYTILQAPKETVVAFLQGLFDSDGYFERYNVGIATVSKKMSDQIMMMLLNMGIVPRRRVKAHVDQEHKRAVYEITICGDAMRVFAREIGFKLPRKKEALERYLVSHRYSNTNVDLFPHITGIIEKNWKTLSSKGLSTSGFAGLMDKVRTRKRISRNSLGKFLHLFKENKLKNEGIEYLENLFDVNIFLSPITKIEHGMARVFDFTVPKYHSFISNGLISHNTLLARAVAGEANVPFFSISGSEFVEMFVGVGSARVRDLFATAKKASPSIIFIDELDAIGRHRGAGIGGGHDEREQTLNMILVEMDGFDKESGVIVIAATNRGDILDPALLRPGRFDRKIVLDPPDVHDREEILKIHSKEKPLASNVNFKEIAERTPGFSGADLANVANEAALLAARENKTQIFQIDFLEAIEKVLLGPERKSHILSKKEKEITAYHEAGHALVSSSIPGTDPVRKISIISRGMAGGYTFQVQSEENKLRTKTQFLAEIATLMGGMCAEKLMFGEMSTGASNDLEKASHLARKIVKEWGMSSLGPISFGDKEEMVFLGKEISEQRNYSEVVAEKIDHEVETIIKGAEKRAAEILAKRKNMLEKIAKTLVEKETIEREEFEKIMGVKSQITNHPASTRRQGEAGKPQTNSKSK